METIPRDSAVTPSARAFSSIVGSGRTERFCGMRMTLAAATALVSPQLTWSAELSESAKLKVTSPDVTLLALKPRRPVVVPPTTLEVGSTGTSPVGEPRRGVQLGVVGAICCGGKGRWAYENWQSRVRQTGMGHRPASKDGV
jgi:hypothetical protein